MNRIIHFEMNSPDVQASMTFFRDGFGWEFNTWAGEIPYHLAHTGEEGTPGINGAIMASQDGQPRTVNIVEVASIDDSISKLTGLGGTCVVDKIAIPGVGYSAYFTDPAGVFFGIFQAEQNVSG